MTLTRRLAAILAADVVSYSRLIGADEEGTLDRLRAIRADLIDPPLCQAALAHYFCREYDAAVAAAKRTIGSYPTYPIGYLHLAEALGQLGRKDEAQEALKSFLSLVPPTWVDTYFAGRSAWMRPEDHAHMVDGLRKAGWTG